MPVIFLLWCIFLLLSTLAASSLVSLSPPNYDIPTYSIDPFVLQISEERYRACGLHRSRDDDRLFAFSELQFLYNTSASEYFRGHELLAYEYFVEQRARNPHYRESLREADLEYVPILSLHWRTTSDNEHCGYTSFIKYLLRIWNHFQSRDRSLSSLRARHDDDRCNATINNNRNSKNNEKNNNKKDDKAGDSDATVSRLPVKFFVGSTFNMRTEWGRGMPSQLRRGEVYENISALTTALSVGHYERWPECPDLLRKWWKYVVELPYLDPALSSLHSYDLTQRETITQAQLKSIAKEKRRIHSFLFAGNFELPGPERVCSVRNALLDLAHRADTVIVNVTLADSTQRGVSQSVVNLIEESIFCLITPGQSYSTSFFYHAIAHGCVPVVIDDWFTFAFPWKVQYELFVIRINEVDFLTNPIAVVEEILRVYLKPAFAHNDAMSVLEIMRMEMKKAAALLSFSPLSPPLSSTSSPSPLRIPVWENLMLELIYAQRPHVHFNNVPCPRPHMCKPWTSAQRETVMHSTNESLAPCLKERDYLFVDNKQQKLKWLSAAYHEADNSQSPIYNSIFRDDRDVQLHNDGYQASALFVSPSLLTKDVRSHLCRHRNRLIGMYKMVFFMQCVRVLWPLQPGKFRNADNIARFDKPSYDAEADRGPGISHHDMKFVLAFHNISHQEMIGWSWTNVVMYPPNESSLPFVKNLSAI